MSDSYRNNRTEILYDSGDEYDHYDPDLVEEVASSDNDTRRGGNKVNKALTTGNTGGPSPPVNILAPENDPANDPKRMIKYQSCWLGFLINLAAAFGFGYIIFKQFDAVADIAKSDQLVLGSVFKIRYALVFVYFVACLLHKPYVHEFRNSEAPIIAYSILEIYYNLYDPKNGNFYGLFGAVALPAICCSRRKRLMHFFNPWNKDKTDVKKFIAAARRYFADLNDI